MSLISMNLGRGSRPKQMGSAFIHISPTNATYLHVIRCLTARFAGYPRRLWGLVASGADLAAQ